MDQLLPNGNVRFAIRDLVAAVFRHRVLLAICFVGTVMGTVAGMLVHPKYESTMKILLQRERLDPVITTQPSAVPMELASTSVSEEELNSEVELLTSGDVLKEVVLQNHLDYAEKSWIRLSNRPNELVARAVMRLKKKLVAEAVSKANVITVSYSSSQPEVARDVLLSLSNSYIQKHVALHRPAGKIEFFDQEVERSRKNLADTEERLITFTRGPGGTSPDVQKQLAVQKVAELSSTLQQTRTAMQETEERLAVLQQLQATLPDRVTTQSRKSDNAQLLEQLKSTIVSLQLKRSELLAKYEPGYRLIQDIDGQITEIRATLDAETSKPLSDETTDRNPVRNWVDSELAKAESELPVLKVRFASVQQGQRRYQEEARELYSREVEFEDLSRTAKAEEDNYFLYLHKREEARITGALDERRILNLALIQEPDLPALPMHAPWTYGLEGCVLAILLSAGALVIAEYSDDTFRTPDEVRQALGVGLVAALSTTNHELASFGNVSGRRIESSRTSFKQETADGKSYLTSSSDSQL